VEQSFLAQKHASFEHDEANAIFSSDEDNSEEDAYNSIQMPK